MNPLQSLRNFVFEHRIALASISSGLFLALISRISTLDPSSDRKWSFALPTGVGLIGVGITHLFYRISSPSRHVSREEQELLQWEPLLQYRTLGFQSLCQGVVLNERDQEISCVEVVSIYGDTDWWLNERIPYRKPRTEAILARLGCDSKILAVGNQRVSSPDELFSAFYAYIASQPPIETAPLKPIELTVIHRGLPSDEEVCRESESVRVPFDLNPLAHWLKHKIARDFARQFPIAPHASYREKMERDSAIFRALPGIDCYFVYYYQNMGIQSPLNAPSGFFSSVN